MRKLSIWSNGKNTAIESIAEAQKTEKKPDEVIASAPGEAPHRYWIFTKQYCLEYNKWIGGKL